VNVYREKCPSSDRISILQVFIWCYSSTLLYLGKGEYLFLCYRGSSFQLGSCFAFNLPSLIAHGQQIKQFTFEREKATDANAFFRNETPIPISFLHNQNQFSGSVLYRFLCLPFGGFSRTFPIFIFIWPAASTHLFSPCFSFQLTIFHIGFHNFAAFQFSVSLRQHSLLF